MHRLALAPLAALTVVAGAAAANAADANPIGARIYAQPWDAHAPSQDAVQTIYDDPNAISGTVDTAWNTARQAAMTLVPKAFAEYDVGDGFRLYDINLTLNPVPAYTLRRTGPNTAQLEFTIPATTVETSIRVPGPTPNGLDPRFKVSGDLVIDVELAFSNNPDQLMRAAKVNAVLRNVGLPEGENDSAKAISSAATIANDLVTFVSGTDFEQKLLDSINGQDIGQQALQPSINQGLDLLNAQFRRAPQLGAYLPKAVWADHDRLTFYFAPQPIAPPTGGSLSGAITWDPTQVVGDCSRVAMSAAVQTGPRPLLDSSGEDFGAAPTATIGYLASSTAGPDACSYQLSGLAAGMPNALTVSTTFSSIGGVATSSPYAGRLSPAAVISPVGWDDSSVTPSASGRGFRIGRGMAGGSGVGGMASEQLRRPLDPGDERPNASVTNTRIINQVSVGEANSINPQPLPPRIGRTQQSVTKARTAASQAPAAATAAQSGAGAIK